MKMKTPHTPLPARPGRGVLLAELRTVISLFVLDWVVSGVKALMEPVLKLECPTQGDPKCHFDLLHKCVSHRHIALNQAFRTVDLAARDAALNFHPLWLASLARLANQRKPIKTHVE